VSGDESFVQESTESDIQGYGNLFKKNRSRFDLSSFQSSEMRLFYASMAGKHSLRPTLRSPDFPDLLPDPHTDI